MISGMMALCLILSLVPVQALAEETVPEESMVETTAAVEETTEAVTEAVEATTAFTETETLPTEGTTAPTEAETEATEETVVVETVENAFQEAVYAASGTCGDSATWSYLEGVLTISGTGPMSRNSYGSTPWKNYKDNITTVVVEEGITSIGSYSFQYFSNLTSVSLPGTLKEIGSNAFSNCTGLQQIQIPDSVTFIWGSAFSYCTSLISIELPDGITRLDGNTFCGCSKLASVKLPAALQEIRMQDFSRCESLVSIDLPATLKTIDGFDGCYSLESIVFPEGLEKIDGFSSCYSLTEVTIPASATYMNGNVFDNCKSLQNIWVEDGNPNYCDIDGVLHSKDGKTLISWPGGRSGHYTICDGVEIMGRSAFSGGDLTSVTIPSSVTIAGGFCSCKQLKSIVLPDNITVIDDYAFMNSGLSSITIPDSVTEIGYEAFQSCNALTSIEIPDSVTTMDSLVFNYCENLVEVKLSRNISTLDSTFADCWNLASVILPENLTGLTGTAFGWCYALTNIALPDSLSAIGDYAFTGSGLETVRIPAAVESIGHSTFKSCDNLQTVIFTGSAPAIGSNAFSGVSATVYYPNDDETWTVMANQNYGGSLLWEMGDGSGAAKDLYWNFDAPSGTLTITGNGPMGNYVMATVPWRNHREEIKNVIIGEGITTVGEMTFCNFQNLTSVSIPSTVTEIGSSAFAYCTNLTSVDIPSGVTVIGKKAFFECSQITGMTIPGGVEEIGSEAFRGCSILKNLTLKEGIRTIGVNAFAECVFLPSVTIPASVTNIGDGAFGSCSSLSAFSVAEGNADYSAVDGILYDRDQTTLILAPTAITGVCNVPETVRNISNKAFWRCADLRELVFTGTISSIGLYAFYESTLSVCYPRDDVSWRVMKGDYGGSITWVPMGLLKTEGDLHYISSANGKQGRLDYTYADEWFYEDCTRWQPELARMSMRMALSAAQTKSTDIEDLYWELEFQDTTVWYPQPTPDTVGYIIGSKMMRDVDDEESTLLVAVTIRGGGYGPELTQDFRLGIDDEHSGYSVAADKVVSAIRKHINSTGIKNNIKIWITGFGRGGSIANIAAHRLNTYADDGETIPGLSRAGIYAYCFGNSQVVRTDSAGYKTADKNILNLINPNDYTAYLAPTNWGYARYGTDYYLPTSMHMFTEYWDAYLKMQAIFVEMLIEAGNVEAKLDPDTGKIKTSFGELVWEVPLQSSLIQTVSHDLAWLFMDEYAYYRDNQEDMIAAIKHQSWDMNYAPVGKLLKVLVELLPDGTVVDLFKDVQGTADDALDCFTHAHWPDLWVAWLYAIEDDSVLQKSLNTRSVSINCPVDLSVYSSSGTLVAQFVDDVPQTIPESTIHAYLDSNGQKIVVLPTDADFRIETTATDDGTVSYQMQEYDIANGVVTRVIDFLDIPIQNGDRLTCTAGSGASAKYTVTDSQGVILEPNGKRTGKEVVNYQLTVAADGNGSVSGSGRAIVNSYRKVTAEAGEDALFVGWYLEDKLVSREAEYRFRLEGDTSLTAKFIPRDSCTLVMQEYIALQCEQTVQMTAEVYPEILADHIEWTTDNENRICVDPKSGEVTAREVGTAYVIATVSADGMELTARCRVDVAAMEEEEPKKLDIEGIQLSSTKVTTELYSTNYAGLDILLKLPQNYPSVEGVMTASGAAAMAQAGVKENGVAIETARFTDEAMAKLFAISVLDDRRVQIAPTDYAVENPKEVKSKYTGTITVTVQGGEYTSEVLTLTVKKSTPKLKASVSSFNSFRTSQSRAIKITGGTVTKICENAARTTPVPGWLTLEEGILHLNENTPKKSTSGKVYLLVETEEWRIPAAVTLTVKNSYKAPGLKLSASSVTMTRLTEDSQGIQLKLRCTSKKDTLEGLKVTGINAPDGYIAENFNIEDGSFVLKAEEGFQAGKIKLTVTFGDTDRTVTLALTVKTATVSLKLSAKTVTLNTVTGSRAQVRLTASPSDYLITAPTITGNEAEELALTYEDGILTVGTNEKTVPGKTYKLSVKAGGSKAVTLSVKTTATAPMVTYKASGSLDLSFPQRAVTVKPTFKNYSGGFAIGEMTAKNAKKEAVDFFRADKDDKNILVTCGGEIPTGSYTLTLTLKLEDETTVKNTVKVTVKRTAVKLKLSATKLTLNKAIGDSGSIRVTCATKDYAFGEPVWRLMDKSGKTGAEGKLDIGYADDRLTVSVNDSTEYGAAYKLLVRANEYAPATTVTVTVPGKTKSTVKSSLKASGTIDVVRAGSSVTLTPGYSNCGGGITGEETLYLYSSADGYGEPVNHLFRVERDDRGRYILRGAEGLDHSKSYKAQLVTSFGEMTVKSPMVTVKEKMGSAKLTLTAEGKTLFANDRNDRISFSLTAKDSTLNAVEKVTIKSDKNKLDQKLEIISYGNGRFAIAFKDGNVHKSLLGKTVTINLNVWLEGNETAKVNASVKMKVSIVR